MPAINDLIDKYDSIDSNAIAMMDKGQLTDEVRQLARECKKNRDDVPQSVFEKGGKKYLTLDLSTKESRAGAQQALDGLHPDVARDVRQAIKDEEAKQAESESLHKAELTDANKKADEKPTTSSGIPMEEKREVIAGDDGSKPQTGKGHYEITTADGKKITGDGEYTVTGAGSDDSIKGSSSEDTLNRDTITGNTAGDTIGEGNDTLKDLQADTLQGVNDPEKIGLPDGLKNDATGAKLGGNDGDSNIGGESVDTLAGGDSIKDGPSPESLNQPQDGETATTKAAGKKSSKK